MRFIAASALSFCFVPAVLSSAIPIVPDTSPAPDKRVFPLTAPQRDVVCLGYTVPVSDILAAINQGAAWATTDPLTKMGKNIIPSIPFSHLHTPNPSLPSPLLSINPTILTLPHPSRRIQIPAPLQQPRTAKLPRLRWLSPNGISCSSLRQQPLGARQKHQVTRQHKGTRPGDLRRDESDVGHVLRRHHARCDQDDGQGEAGCVCFLYLLRMCEVGGRHFVFGVCKRRDVTNGGMGGRAPSNQCQPRSLGGVQFAAIVTASSVECFFHQQNINLKARNVWIQTSSPSLECHPSKPPPLLRSPPLPNPSKPIHSHPPTTPHPSQVRHDHLVRPCIPSIHGAQ